MTTSPTNRPSDDSATHRKVSWRSPEILGELVLLAVIAALIVVFLFALPDLRLPGRWLPLVTIGFATPLWFIRLYTILSRRKAIEQGMIMDLGFRVGEDPEAEKRRALLYFGTLILLALGVWVIGFHFGLPLWVMAYLAFWTRSKWYYVLLAGVAFESVIVGILDLTLDIIWFEPLLFRWIGVAYPINDMFSRIF